MGKIALVVIVILTARVGFSALASPDPQVNTGIAAAFLVLTATALGILILDPINRLIQKEGTQDASF